MNQESRFEKALQTPNPGQGVRSLVLDLGREGRTRQDVYGAFQGFLLNLRQSTRPSEEQEHLILDTMDALTDWCHPDAQLLRDK